MLTKFNLRDFVIEKLCSCARSQEIIVIPDFLWRFNVEQLWNEALQTFQMKILKVALLWIFCLWWNVLLCWVDSGFDFSYQLKNISYIDDDK